MQVQAINASMPARQANFGSAAGKAVALATALTTGIAGNSTAAKTMEKIAPNLPGFESQAYLPSIISKDGKVVSNFRPREIQPAKTAELNVKAPVVNDPWYMQPENIMHSQEFKSSNGKSYTLNFAHDPISSDSGVSLIHLVPKNSEKEPLKVIGTVVHIGDAGNEEVGFYCWNMETRAKGEIPVPADIAEQVFSLREGGVQIGSSNFKPSKALLSMFKSDSKYSYNTDDMSYVAFSLLN